MCSILWCHGCACCQSCWARCNICCDWTHSATTRTTKHKPKLKITSFIVAEMEHISAAPDIRSAELSQRGLWSLQYSFQPQRDALRLQRAAAQERGKVQTTAPRLWLRKEKKRKDLKYSNYPNQHPGLYCNPLMPRDTKLVQAIVWACIKRVILVCCSVLYNLLVSQGAEPNAAHSWLPSSCLISPALLTHVLPGRSCHSRGQPL